MVERRLIFKTFIVVFIFSALLLILSGFGVLNWTTGVFSKITSPVQKSFYMAFGHLLAPSNNIVIKKLQEENLTLNKKIVDQAGLEKDIQALRDQFAIDNPKPTNLLPATVLGFPSFIPNISMPETLLIDRGSEDGIVVGQAVVSKDNLVGRIVKTTLDKSLVYLITHPDFTFTAKILNSKTEGIVRGLGGGEMILDNVLLSDTVKKQDLVLTKGDLTIDNKGFPGDLVVGKIVAVDKIPSALFQTAGIKSLLDFSKLETVFIYIGSKQ
jgi:rod shape-determining protein MreC